MLAVVKKPHIEIKARRVPSALIKFLRDSYQDVIIQDDSDEKAVSFENSPFYKDIRSHSTPGEMIVAARGLRGMTQAELAQVISALENDRRSVSRTMAAKLGKFFGCGADAFFVFE